MRKYFYLFVIGAFLLALPSLVMGAIIDSSIGKVTIIKADSKEVIPARAGETLSPMDQIQTMADSFCVLLLESGMKVTINENTLTRVSSLLPKKEISSEGPSLFSRLFSSLKSKLSKSGNRRNMTAVVGVRGANVSRQETSSLVAPSELYWAE